MCTKIGNGTNTLFWEDRWLLGQRIQDLSPLIVGMVPKRIASKRTVSEAISDMCWVRDIYGVASTEVIMEFIKLWDIVSGVATAGGGGCTLLAPLDLWKIHSKISI
ncbi:hypothetical protein PR202_gb20284 [Eleusine coracana subsp. coracana]|uniref:Uncharacterized protein n=1 Tax=Eleusine coracana subsp. coracana TaxID=191504 RepID=A0AAV5FA41_ELECO|nr:hypothetical protein PR202_gb20284 [Eleusine coracana subsp. coracana]